MSAPLPLHYTSMGEGPPVLILHGLFGSARNWRTVSAKLADRYRVYAVDLRNHGESPHASTMSYEAMAGDVAGLMARLGLAPAAVVGHSLGGKVAMWLALAEPQRLARLVVVDIAPVAYPDRLSAYLDAMEALPLAGVRSLADADRLLTAAVPDRPVRQLLLQNLRLRDGEYRWRIDLAAIRSALGALLDFPLPRGAGAYEGPCYFIRGERSDAVTASQSGLIRALFPKAAMLTVAQAGHWPHAEQPEAFLAALRRALSA